MRENKLIRFIFYEYLLITKSESAKTIWAIMYIMDFMDVMVAIIQIWNKIMYFMEFMDGHKQLTHIERPAQSSPAIDLFRAKRAGCYGMKLLLFGIHKIHKMGSWILGIDQLRCDPCYN